MGEVHRKDRRKAISWIICRAPHKEVCGGPPLQKARISLDIDEVRGITRAIGQIPHSCGQTPVSVAFDTVDPELVTLCPRCGLGKLQAALERRLRKMEHAPVALDSVLSRDRWLPSDLIDAGFDATAVSYAIVEMRRFSLIEVDQHNKFTGAKTYRISTAEGATKERVERCLRKTQQAHDDERAIQDAVERLDYQGYE